jgi:hypothetical protein
VLALELLQQLTAAAHGASLDARDQLVGGFTNFADWARAHMKAA